MKSWKKVLIASVICMANMGVIPALASMNPDTEAPIAGISVALNNYYTRNEEPQKTLAEELDSRAQMKGNGWETAPAVSEETGAAPEGTSLSEQAAPEDNREETAPLEEPRATVTEKSAPAVSAKASPYENVAVSQVSGYVNVRSEANTKSQIVGKIYNNCAATILETIPGEGGDWYHIQSGSVSGYIKAQYFVTGDKAEKLAKEVGVEYATINTASLRLRAEPNLTSQTLTTLSQGARYEVQGEENNFAKLTIDTDLTGYVSMDYIKTTVEFRQAVSLEEEAARKAEEAKRRQEAEAAINQLNAVLKTETGAAGQNSASSQTGTASTTVAASKPASTTAPVGVNGTIAANPAGNGGDASAEAPVPQTVAKETSAAVSSGSAATIPAGPSAAPNTGNMPGPGVSYGPGGNASDKVVSATRTAIVAYAKQFLGNPYVYGGTSLTDGADCSGFTMSVYKHLGIDIGRTSRDQAAGGREISRSAMQPGDLLFYASGDYINHVAMYIGGGQVIHSSTPATGITLSPADYRTPCKVVTFLD